MAISFPTLTEVVNKAKTGIKNALPTSNPFLRNSFLEAIATMAGGRVYDFYYNEEKNVLPELFLNTARDRDSIDTLVQPFSITSLAATQSSGIIIATGTLTTIIPSGTTFQDSNGSSFLSTASATIDTINLIVTGITQVGGIATAILTDHSFFSGLSVTISGANEADYNGVFDIIVLDKDTFTYNINPAAPTPATGTITASAIKADVNIQSVDFGAAQNLEGGNELTVTTPIIGLDDSLFVQYPGLSGGSDIESKQSLRERGLDRYANPSGNFTEGDVERAVKLDRDNTRVFVQPITPAPGQVTVFFVQDNAGTGTDILPGAAAVTTATNNIIAISPAPFDFTNDLFVSAPTPVIVDFTFLTITPNTLEMQTAINNSLIQFFQEVSTVGVNILEIEYNSAIINTVDATGTKLQNFTLNNPIGDITIAAGELGILGSVTFL